MAANSKAIGLLFEVAGTGNINGETGRRINGQLRNIVGQINKSDTVKLKFSIDANHFKREIEDIKRQLQNLNTGSGGTSGGSSGSKAHTDVWRQATAAVNEYYRLMTQVQQAMTRTNDIVANADGTFSTHNQRWADLVQQTNAAKATFDTFNQSSARVNMTLEERCNLDYRINDAQARMNVQMKTFEANGQAAWSNLTAKVNDYITRVELSASRDETAKLKLQELREMANSTDWHGYDALKQKLGEVQTYINQNSLATEKWYQKMLKTFGTRIRSLLAGLILAKVTQYLREIYANVVEIDSALTQLRIVTGASEKQMQRFLTNSIKLAKELGASIKDVLASVETFSRLGYGIEDATVLSQYATILSKVANVTAEEATTGLTSILKGYGFDPSDSEHIADVLVEVGQKYAVSAAELMTAYEKAGAALNATNTSFEKSAGLIAAANASVQDASVVGTALKTVSARIRKSKTELDELGESSEDLAESFSVYANEIEKITGFSILIEGTTDKYKDLYDIFNGIAQSWDKLGDTERSRVAEILGGTRQYQVISSILSNWSDSVNAYSSALNSAGTSLEAMSIYTDSVQGRIEQLKATFEELSADLLDSSLVKGVVNILTGVLSILDGIIKLIDMIGGLNVVLGITAGLVAVIKAEAIVAFVHGVITSIGAFITSAKAAVTQMFSMISASRAAKTSMTGLATSEQLAALKTAELRVAMLKLVAVVAAITIVIEALKALDKAWEDSYESHLEAAEKYTEEADGYATEIDSLTALQQKLQEARGNKAALAKIYDDLNQKISVSTKLMDGETGAYLAANQQLQDRIEYLKQLEEQTRKTAIAEQRSAFNDNKAKRAGDILHDWLGFTSNALFMWDWAASDATGDQMRAAMRGTLEGASFNGHNIDYDYFYNQMTEEQRGIWLRQQGMEQSDWDDYWSAQVKTALNAFSGVINTYDGYLGQDFITNVVKTLVMHGYDLDEIDGAVEDLEAADGEVESLIDDYYTSLANKDAKSSEYYDKIVAKLDEIKAKYPELADQIKSFTGSISTSITVADDSDVLKLRSVYSILESISGEYDALVDAMEEMDEYGSLTAKTFSSMIKDYPDLINYLTQTENGYILNANALIEYTSALIESYTAEAALAAMTAENKETAIQNLKNLQTALAMLAVSSSKVKSDTNARKDALNDEKDALKDQLDAYKRLIDLRKDLLKQYEDELKYKRELEKKEREVARLQTLYTVSQLDTSAAGRAKTRQLAKELKDAQEELDDFTLEHAIDVVTSELDSQYDEYKRFIDGKLDAIEDAIDALGSSNSSSASGISYEIASAAASAASKIADAIAKIDATPVVNVTVSGTDSDGSSALQEAQAYIKSHKLLQGDKARWAQDPTFRTIWNKLTPAEQASLTGYTQGKAQYDANGRLTGYELIEHDWMKKVASGGGGGLGGRNVVMEIKHGGGIVGDFTRLKSTETFAKLLKGEFVATPAMMENFMNKTLPAVASSGSTNEFNAPLVEINCESVTQDALPKLKEIVDDAVKEIKSQLDSGMSRAGYRKPARKINI